MNIPFGFPPMFHFENKQTKLRIKAVYIFLITVLKCVYIICTTVNIESGNESMYILERAITFIVSPTFK